MPIVKESMIVLSALLHALTMEELHDIRRALHVEKASQLNKTDLGHRLSAYMVDHLEEHLERMDPDRYSLLKKVMKAPGSILPVSELSDNEYYEPMYFQQYGFLFLIEGAVIMPHEIRERLHQVDEKRLKPILDRNSQWIRLTQGLLYYYGSMGVKTLIEKVEHYTGQSIDDFEYRNVIHDLEQYDYSVQYSEFGFSHFLVDDPQRIQLEHHSRSELDYYPFTKAQVLRAADDEYVDRHTGYRQFVSFLHKHWEMDEEEADLIAADLAERIQRGDSPSELVSGLQEELEFTGMDQLQQLSEVLMALMNNTRLWELKGHTPEELFKEERKHLKPLPKHPFQVDKPVMSPAPQETGSSGTVYSFQTKMKVGRNDPCPCGSGRKFKKCCGAL
ncbi:SEC-C metal-binding domain-containing protein [Ferviditalea candida]|uniref:SEC-C metal-binding domain-containing protein n=1 Tax=Ferviditalea candida TaxID=3108399 RepID=A0ABU5ZMR3_9BACL|nr:SEC-C metal-binding domain-containing protein [Paenibacillaceae bacterium T2]